MPLEDSLTKLLHLVRRDSLRPELLDPATKCTSKPTMPVEILEQIAHECLGNIRSFKDVVALSSTSRLLRGIVMRIFFRHTRMISTVTVDNFAQILGLPTWIRYLKLNNYTLTHLLRPETPLQLQSLNLHTLEIYLAGAPAPIAITDALPPTLRVLRITSLAHIGPATLLAGVARSCKELQELELSVADALDRTCCWQCFAESESRVVHSPVAQGKRAQTLEQVIDTYADALRPLAHLRRLALGVFISPASLLTTHVDLHRADSRPYATEGTPAYDIASAQHTPATASHGYHVKMSDYKLVEAPPALNLQDHVRRFGYFATPTQCMDCVREYGEIVRRDELHATVRLAQRLKGLESVWWSSWFSGDDREGSAGAMWTRLSVAREGVRLRVARQKRGYGDTLGGRS